MCVQRLKMIKFKQQNREGWRRTGDGVGMVRGKSGARVPKDWGDAGVTEDRGVPNRNNPLQPKRWRVGVHQTACKSVAEIE